MSAPRRRWSSDLRRALVAALALAAAGPRADARDLPEIEKSGTLRVLVALPAGGGGEFFNPGPKGDPGFDHEILREFARARHVRLVVVPLARWDDLVPRLEANRGDVAAGRLTNTASRRERIAFTIETFPTHHVVITRKPHRVVETVEQLREERVGTVPGTSLEEEILAAGVPADRIDRGFASSPALQQGLVSGRVTAIVWGTDSALLPLRRDTSLQMGTFVGKPDSLAFGVRKQDTALKAALDEHIRKLKATGAWAALLRKYFGSAADIVIPQAANE